MFKLCAFSDEAGSSVREQIEALVDNGIPYLEVRGVGGRNFIQLSVSEAASLKEELAARNLSVWSVGSPIGKIGIREPFAPHFEEFKHTLELAETVGARCIRLFSFYIPQGEDPSVCRDEVMERLMRFAEEAEGHPVCLCHENEKGIYGDTAPRCLDIHEHLPQIRCVFDPANFVQCGQDTKEAWKLLGDKVYYMHIKDARKDGSVVPAGEGDGNLGYLLRQYDGKGASVLTLEPHLSDFVGLGALENAEKSKVDAHRYSTGRAAFDAAASALKALLAKEKIG